MADGLWQCVSCMSESSGGRNRIAQARFDAAPQTLPRQRGGGVEGKVCCWAGAA